MSDSHFSNSPEIWKAIPGWPGYDVSNVGRVRSYWRQVPKYWRQGTESILDNQPQRIRKPSLDTSGYPIVRLCRDGKSCTQTIHRLILLAFVGPCPPGYECCHKNGIRTHCFLDNLEWGTRSKNQSDRIKHGNMPDYKGMNHHQRKLSDIQVLEIRKLYGQGLYSQHQLGKMFNVSRGAIQGIINRTNWTHI